MKRTGPTNTVLQKTIAQLKAQKVKLWKRVAYELERVTRQRREVNLSRIDMFANNGEIVLVPGKVLASGILTKKVTVVAWSFSAAAKDKIKAAGGKVMTLEELVKANPKGTGVKVIG